MSNVDIFQQKRREKQKKKKERKNHKRKKRKNEGQNEIINGKEKKRTIERLNE